MPKTLTQQLADHEKFAATEPRYVVVCSECGQDWEPLVRSPLWWRAKKKADKGYLDALYVSGKDCGCVKECYHPDAPYRVIGYNWDCIDFNIPCNTFVEAIQAYRRHKMDTVFIKGVSKTVEDALEYGLN